MLRTCRGGRHTGALYLLHNFAAKTALENKVYLKGYMCIIILYAQKICHKSLFPLPTYGSGACHLSPGPAPRVLSFKQTILPLPTTPPQWPFEASTAGPEHGLPLPLPALCSAGQPQGPSAPSSECLLPLVQGPSPSRSLSWLTLTHPSGLSVNTSSS